MKIFDLFTVSNQIHKTIFNAVVSEEVQHPSSLDGTEQQQGYYKNPLARKIRDGQITFTNEQYDLMEYLRDDVKLVFCAEHIGILRKFYDEIKLLTSDPILGNLAKICEKLKFEEFILRLFKNRFKVAYLDGRLVLSDKTGVRDPSGDRGRDFFDKLYFSEELLADSLTLPEIMLSTLIVPHGTSLLIGDGRREKRYDSQAELIDSLPVAGMSFLSGPEFRRGYTVHPDFTCIMKIVRADTHEVCYALGGESRENLIKNYPAILNTAHRIYGDTLAFETEYNPHDSNWLTFGPYDPWWIDGAPSFQVKYVLYKPAYLARTEIILRTDLIINDINSKEKFLGTVHQMKGLGLGAFFGFQGRNPKTQKEYSREMEELLLEALENVLNKISLTHITHINILNWPSDYFSSGNATSDAANIKEIFFQKKFPYKVTRCTGEPYAKDPRFPRRIGSANVCSDITRPGNEANLGMPRESSDDTANLYCILNPSQFDVSKNPRLTSSSCIYVISTIGEVNELAPLISNTDFPEQALFLSPIESIQKKINTDDSIKVVMKNANNQHVSLQLQLTSNGAPNPELQAPEDNGVDYLDVYCANDLKVPSSISENKIELLASFRKKLQLANDTQKSQVLFDLFVLQSQTSIEGMAAVERYINLKNLPQIFFNACRLGYAETVESTLKSDNLVVDTTLLDLQGLSPFYLASANGQAAVAEILLKDPRVDVNYIPKTTLGGTHEGLSPFYAAIFNGHVAVIKIMLASNRIDPNELRYNTPAYIIAYQQGQYEIAQLLAQSPRVNFHLTLQKHEERELVEKLLSHPAIELYNLLSNPAITWKDIFEYEHTSTLLVIIKAFFVKDGKNQLESCFQDNTVLLNPLALQISAFFSHLSGIWTRATVSVKTIGKANPRDIIRVELDDEEITLSSEALMKVFSTIPTAQPPLPPPHLLPGWN